MRSISTEEDHMIVDDKCFTLVQAALYLLLVLCADGIGRARPCAASTLWK